MASPSPHEFEHGSDSDDDWRLSSGLWHTRWFRVYQWPRHLRYSTTFETFDRGDLQFYRGSSHHRFCCSSINEGCVVTEIIVLVLGTFLGGGLSSAGMTNPSKIVNFLDITGTSSPSLIFVMGGGIPVVAVSFLILKKLEKPLVFDDIQVPTHGVIDR